MQERIAKFLRFLYQIEAVLASVAYAIAAGILLYDVVTRELGMESYLGAQKIAVFGTIIAAFLGLSLATAAGRHLKPAFVKAWVPNSWDPAMERLSNTLSGVIYITLAIYGIDFVLQSIEYDDKVAVLRWQLWPFRIVLPVAFGLSALRHFCFAIWPGLTPVPEEGKVE